jgi:hypothetical protein
MFQITGSKKIKITKIPVYQSQGICYNINFLKNETLKAEVVASTVLRMKEVRSGKKDPGT